MSVLSLELIIASAWIIYQFVKGYNSKHPNQEQILRKIGYGKSMGVFALATGFLGQMIGFIGMFEVLSNHPDVGPANIYKTIRVTMISSTYGVLIFLVTMILWFIATMIIERKTNS